MKKYQELANTIGALVDQKNEAYGNSFDQAGEFLKMLYPQGVSPENYNDMLCIVRMFDKLKRIATKKDAFGEDPFADIVGYGLLAVHRNKQPKCGEEVGEKQLLMEKTVLKEVSESVVAPEATEYFKKFDLTSPVYSIKKFDPNHQETTTTVEREMLQKALDTVLPRHYTTDDAHYARPSQEMLAKVVKQKTEMTQEKTEPLINTVRFATKEEVAKHFRSGNMPEKTAEETTPEHVTGQDPLTLIANQMVNQMVNPTPVTTTFSEKCNQYIPGHHAGNCTLEAGHEGYCRE